MKTEVKIVGCGVSGLTVGVTLLEAGYGVEIITERLPEETTSSKAAAIWFPYEVNPKEKANKWSKASYNKFLEFCNIPNSGVSMVSLTTLVKKEKDAWWIKALPKNEVRKANKEELPVKYPVGYIMDVPLAETQLYLNFLLAKFKFLNGKLTKRKILNLLEFSNTKTIVVNCTGLASRELIKDNKLFPIHGQIVKAKPQSNINCIAADFTFGETEDKLAYIVPRKDCLILGGTTIKGKEDLEPNPEYTKGIIERCRVLEPKLQSIDIKSIEVGLRPGRHEIRLEREDNIIHNYGHGGGGFTVSWGCALEVKKLIEEKININLDN